MKQVLVYDFDKTLTCNDTLFGFFKYASKKNILYLVKLPIYLSCMIFVKLGLMSNNKLKELGITLFLQNLNSRQLKEKLMTYRHKIKFKKIFYKLKFDDNINYYIVSASFEEYIRPIFPTNVHVLGSAIKLKNGKAERLAFNCYKEKKVLTLNNLNINKIDILYTDSYSDLALAKISKLIVVVDGDNQIICKNINEFKRYFKK